MIPSIAVCVLGFTILGGPGVDATPFPTSKLYHASFDDIPNASPIIGGGQLVGVYQEIDWVGLGLVTAGSGVSTVTGTNPIGVVPHSSPNIADWGIYSVTPNRGNMVAKTKSFDLLDFWFGCIINTAETTADVPTACTVTVSGFYAGTHKKTPTANFNFVPSNLISAPLVHAQLPSGFSRLENVTYRITAPQLIAPVAAGSLDSVGYVVHYT